MRFRLLAVALLSFACFAPPAAADAVSDLRAEMHRRKDVDFVGKLDKIRKKQFAAVKAAVKALDKTAADLAANVKNVSAAAAPLVKAFPDDFPKASTGLKPFVDAAYEQLLTQAQGAVAPLAAAVPAVRNAKLRNAAEKSRAAAAVQLGLAETATSIPAGFKNIANALQSIAKGLASVAKDPIVEILSADYDDPPDSQFVADEIIVQYRPTFDLLTISGDSATNGKYVSIDLIINEPVTRDGTFTASVEMSVGASPSQIDATYSTNSASVQIEFFSAAAKKIKAKFSFTAGTAGGAGPLKVVHVTGGVAESRRISFF